ncbi:MAG: HNH endonuclease [Sylvanvirus sp.]|uniref:HNH endonuclease n=1 Tax=Sylvanvirus sp. TaxID=2487774 RepID=A0A3G5ALY8_9VIRU|nr:MAG: HNH endonuclease [Sylvanvirus sp.]
MVDQWPDLAQFDPSCIRADDLQLIQAPRRAGKSTLLLQFLYSMAPKIVTPVVISHTERSTHFFEQCGIKPQFIHHQFDDSILGSAFERAKLFEESPPEGYTYLEDSNVHFFLEDCLNDKSLFKGPNIHRLVFNGRHSDLGATILSQYLAVVNKDSRSQFDRVVLLHDASRSNRRFAFEHCFGDMEWSEFDYYYTKYTSDRGALIYSKNEEVTPKYTWFRADKPMLDAYRHIPPQWNPRSTVNEFCEYYPVTKLQRKMDWTLVQHGLHAIPGIMREPVAKKPKRTRIG